MKNITVKILFIILGLLSAIAILFTSQIVYFEYVQDTYYLIEVFGILSSIFGYITLIKLEKQKPKEVVKVIYKTVEQKAEHKKKEDKSKNEKELINQIVSSCLRDLDNYINDKDKWWDQFFHNVSKTLHVAAGILFLWNEEDKLYYGAASSAAYLAGEELKNKKYELGQGLIGQVAKDRKILYIDNVPEGYIIIYSGLVKGTARYLIFIPIVKNNRTMAVIELASFSPVPEPKEKILENLSKKLSGLNLNFLNF